MVGNYAVVFPVAGISSRFGGRPKYFVKVGPKGESLIEYSLNQAIRVGFNKIILIVGEHTEDLFKKAFGTMYKGIPITYVKQTYDSRERDRPWGTVDALCTILPVIDCPFVFCNGDDLYGQSSFEVLMRHLESGEICSAAMGHQLSTVLPNEGTVNRGIYQADSSGFVRDLVENFDITRDNLSDKGLSLDSLCSMNIFALHPEIVFALHKVLQAFKESHKGNRKAECLLPTEIANLIKEEKLRIKLYPAKEQWFGVTNPGDEDIVRKQLLEIYA